MDWLPTISLVSHTFAAAQLFACIFCSFPALNWIDSYNYNCRQSSYNNFAVFDVFSSNEGNVCKFPNPYRSIGSVAVAFGFLLIAFLILISRIILWISPISFKYKTPMVGFLLDIMLIIWLFVAALLATIGGTRPGKEKIALCSDADFPLSTDILFAMKITLWFALVGLIIAVIFDFLQLRTNGHFGISTDQNQPKFWTRPSQATNQVHVTNQPITPITIQEPQSVSSVVHHAPHVITIGATHETQLSRNIKQEHHVIVQSHKQPHRESFSSSSDEERHLEQISHSKPKNYRRSDSNTPPKAKERSKGSPRPQVEIIHHNPNRSDNESEKAKKTKRRSSSPAPDTSVYAIPPTDTGNQSDSSYVLER